MHELPETTVVTTDNNRRRNFIIVGIIIVALVIAAILVWLNWSRVAAVIPGFQPGEINSGGLSINQDGPLDSQVVERFTAQSQEVRAQAIEYNFFTQPSWPSFNGDIVGVWCYEQAPFDTCSAGEDWYTPAGYSNNLQRNGDMFTLVPATTNTPAFGPHTFQIRVNETRNITEGDISVPNSLRFVWETPNDNNDDTSAVYDFTFRRNMASSTAQRDFETMAGGTQSQNRTVALFIASDDALYQVIRNGSIIAAGRVSGEFCSLCANPTNGVSSVQEWDINDTLSMGDSEVEIETTDLTVVPILWDPNNEYTVRIETLNGETEFWFGEYNVAQQAANPTPVPAQQSGIPSVDAQNASSVIVQIDGLALRDVCSTEGNNPLLRVNSGTVLGYVSTDVSGWYRVTYNGGNYCVSGDPAHAVLR